MQNSTENHKEASSTTPNTANETHGDNSNLLERRQLPGTPFTLIKQWIDHDPLLDDTRYNYFLVMGDHRLTEPTEKEIDTLEKLYKEQWKIIVNVIAIVTEKMIEQIKEPYETESL